MTNNQNPINNNKGYYVGVDFGGTKILSGVFTNSLECIGTAKKKTKAHKGTEAVIERIARCILEALDECRLTIDDIKAIGIGAPGSINATTGEVIFSPNLEWKNVPLKRALERILNVPVFVDNDCNVSTLGVFDAELGAEPESMIGIFIGTGIGGGIIINRKLYSGLTNTAGEIGHMVIDIDGPKCGCGNYGCFEALASRKAIFTKIYSAIKDGQKTILTELLDGKLEDMRSGDLRRAIKRGDEFVLKVVEQAARYTGIAVANLINILNPEVVALGGGVIEALENEMMPVILDVAGKHAFPGSMVKTKIISCRLGDSAGIIGAAVLAKSSLNP
jgi:glucokinase